MSLLKTPGMTLHLFRVWQLLRFHRVGQFWWRGVAKARRTWWSATMGRFPSVDEALWLADSDFTAVVSARRGIAQSGVYGGMRSGHAFSFLGETRHLGTPINWSLNDVPPVDHLWRFHLHYHDFILDALAGHIRPSEAWLAVQDWIDNYPMSEPGALRYGWHPFCISKRLCNWLILWNAYRPEERERVVLGSMVAQTRRLLGSLEFDLGGNHLLENVRALVFAGVFFDGPESDAWLERASRILHKELPLQMLPHGEHFERSPMYHLHVLEILIDLYDVCRQRRPELSELCQPYIERGGEFLRAIAHPDGKIPLFADSVFDDTVPTHHVLSRCSEANPQTNGPKARALGGYWVYRDNFMSLTFDAAAACVDHLPAHAHADLLTFELSIREGRLIVDTGVYDYAESEMRKYCRGTAAHNLLQIDSYDQFDMWSRFRVGYRGWPSKLRHGCVNGLYWAYATHNSYRRLSVPVVGRWIGCRQGTWYCVDWALGHGTHRFVNRLHLHPRVTIVDCQEESVQLQLDDQEVYLHSLLGTIRSRPSWYCPKFGERHANTAIEVEMDSPTPIAFGWCLNSTCKTLARLSANKAGWQLLLADLVVRVDAHAHEVVIQPVGDDQRS